LVRSRTLPRWLLASLFASLLVVVLAIAGLAWVNRSAIKPLPAYGHMPQFELTDQNGQPFSSASLPGKFVAVGFIYTSCPDICPMLTTNMVHLQGELRKAGLADEVTLLSISVDPEVDTPEVLRQYATDRGADLHSWSFLTGTLPQIQAVITDGFKVAYEKIAPAHAGHGAAPSYQVSHSGKVILVDPQGQVRAYYDGEVLDPAKVLADINKLR
jgi:protein SCO1